MSRESHRSFIERSALKAAQKALERDGKKRTNRASLGAIHVQTVEPWKRILAFLIGAFFVGLTVHAVRDDYHIIAIIGFSALAILFLSVTVFGYRKPIDAVIDSAGDAALGRLLDALF